jgi:hypothetical protein
MEIVFRIALFLSGVINFIPFSLAFLPKKINASYGINVSEGNLELLLRHRAVLFGIVGGLMIFSAVSKRYYDLSVIIGFTSMVSFVLLYYGIGNINAELKKVMMFDVAAIVVLAIGCFCHYFLGR